MWLRGRGPQILQPVVGGITVQVRRRKHDSCHPEPSCPHKGVPTGRGVLGDPSNVSSNQRPSGRQRRMARCGRPQHWHRPPALRGDRVASVRRAGSNPSEVLRETETHRTQKNGHSRPCVQRSGEPLPQALRRHGRGRLPCLQHRQHLLGEQPHRRLGLRQRDAAEPERAVQFEITQQWRPQPSKQFSPPRRARDPAPVPRSTCYLPLPQ
jgi:hypothetical protein